MMARAKRVWPKGVHRVKAKGREYLYYQPGRGTEAQGSRIRLPSAMSPAFWTELRKAQQMAEGRRESG